MKGDIAVNTFQKWILIIATLIFALGTLLSSLTGRYRLPILHDVYSQQHPSARFDTSTGEVEVKHLKKWEAGASSWVKELR